MNMGHKFKTKHAAGLNKSFSSFLLVGYNFSSFLLVGYNFSCFLMVGYNFSCFLLVGYNMLFYLRDSTILAEMYNVHHEAVRQSA
jgi:hypothetical protein